MKVHKGMPARHLKNPVISIGIFDGVHRGHAAIFERVRRKAKEINGESVIVTFWPHPRHVLGKNSDQLKLLTGLEEKKNLIRGHGIDNMVVIPFTNDFSRLSPCSFVTQYLVNRVGISHLVFGFDHHFGHNREGNFENLKSCAHKYGFTLEKLDPVLDKDLRISSSVIREALSRGDVKLASRLLDYQYSMKGKIVGGNKVGRVIGYPTANIKPVDQHKLVPADGVYAVRVIMGSSPFMGMMNIGYRPTLNTNNRNISLEVHIIGFEGDVYNRQTEICFVDRIRDEKQFGSLDELKDQLADDRMKALHILSL